MQPNDRNDFHPSLQPLKQQEIRFDLLKLSSTLEADSVCLLEEAISCLSKDYDEPCAYLATMAEYGLFATHPAYGFMGGVFLRSPQTLLEPSWNPLSDSFLDLLKDRLGKSFKPTKFQKPLTLIDFLLLTGQGYWPESIVRQAHRSWVASHLFFHLPSDVMDALPDPDLDQLMQAFYQGLYKALLEMSKPLKTKLFWVVSSLEQHLGATKLGGLPCSHPLPFWIEDRQVSYGAALLPFSASAFKLATESCAVSPYTPLTTEKLMPLYTVH
jgi:hypothetical protein